MSTYQELKGLKIKYLSSDTSGDRAIEGEVFYNSTTGKVASHIAVGAWSAGSNLITNRKNGSGFGPSTAAAFAGGQVTTPSQNLTEEYNGFGWTTGGNLNTARTQLAGTTAGSQTAGLVFGGNVPPGSAPHANESNATEEYDGTSWTSGNNMATTVTNHGGSGTQTAAFSAGGNEGGTPKNNSQEYDGTNWTNGNNINTARQTLAGMGTQTAGLVVGGEVSPPSSSPGATEEYDGTNWTAGGATNTGRHSSSGGGTQTAGIVFAGTTVSPDAVRDETEQYDGTSWTEVADLATARTTVGGYNGPSSSGICIAGGAPSLTGATEEWNVSTSTTTAGAWASGGNLGTARNGLAGVGATQGTGLVFAGGDPDRALTEEYDGSSWTESGDLNTARRGGGGFGIQTAAVACGGITTANIDLTEEYNGSTWTAGEALPTVSNEIRACAGTLTAGLAAGGRADSTTFLNATYEYDGTDWTSGGALNAARGGIGGSSNATQTAALAFGGYTNTPQNPVAPTTSEEYNGSAWSNAGVMIKAIGYPSGAGTQTDTIISGGTTTSPFAGVNTTSQGYDGTSWSTRPAMATARGAVGAGGTASLAFVAGGYTNTASVNNTEEFTGDTTSLNTAKTIDFD